mmetsp:Transcript_37686/g.70479  ORF Transcript_37686/g.70479 Transcript_37686/m.70479 type:complete len:221 (+) Transcript_37686:1081-1743(+)
MRGGYQILCSIRTHPWIRALTLRMVCLVAAVAVEMKPVESSGQVRLRHLQIARQSAATSRIARPLSMGGILQIQSGASYGMRSSLAHQWRQEKKAAARVAATMEFVLTESSLQAEAVIHPATLGRCHPYHQQSSRRTSHQTRSSRLHRKMLWISWMLGLVAAVDSGMSFMERFGQAKHPRFRIAKTSAVLSSNVGLSSMVGRMVTRASSGVLFGASSKRA